MDHKDTKAIEYLPRAMAALWLQDLCDLETYLKKKGGSEFVYDEELDVFRFPEDGRFAFCRELADWDLLTDRGYLDL